MVLKKAEYQSIHSRKIPPTLFLSFPVLSYGNVICLEKFLSWEGWLPGAIKVDNPPCRAGSYFVLFLICSVPLSPCSLVVGLDEQMHFHLLFSLCEFALFDVGTPLRLSLPRLRQFDS